MVDGRCVTCRHWQPMEKRNYEWYADDSLPDPDDPWGTCKLIEDPAVQPDEKIIAYTQDGSDYWSTLRCRASFGCVLHERQEKDVDE